MNRLFFVASSKCDRLQDFFYEIVTEEGELEWVYHPDEYKIRYNIKDNCHQLELTIETDKSLKELLSYMFCELLPGAKFQYTLDIKCGNLKTPSNNLLTL